MIATQIFSNLRVIGHCRRAEKPSTGLRIAAPSLARSAGKLSTRSVFRWPALWNQWEPRPIALTVPHEGARVGNPLVQEISRPAEGRLARAKSGFVRVLTRISNPAGLCFARDCNSKTLSSLPECTGSDETDCGASQGQEATDAGRNSSWIRRDHPHLW